MSRSSFETICQLDGLQLHDLVTRGISVGALKDAMRRFQVIAVGEILAFLGVSCETSRRRPGGRIDSSASDRAVRLFTAVQQAAHVLGDWKSAERWLMSSAIGLDRRRPIDLLRTDEGASMVKALLTRMEYGVFS